MRSVLWYYQRNAFSMLCSLFEINNLNAQSRWLWLLHNILKPQNRRRVIYVGTYVDEKYRHNEFVFSTLHVQISYMYRYVYIISSLTYSSTFVYFIHMRNKAIRMIPLLQKNHLDAQRYTWRGYICCFKLFFIHSNFSYYIALGAE